MKNLLKQFFYVFVIGGSIILSGCGYTNLSTVPNGIKTIAVPMFKNQIRQGDTYTYEAGMEAGITNDIINRLNYDGNLKVVKREKADAILEGVITTYEQETIRFEDRAKVKQYRLFISVDVDLIDNRTGKTIWQEKGFTGKTEYLRTGAYARTKRAATRSAREDLAKKLVDRIVEDW